MITIEKIKFAMNMIKKYGIKNIIFSSETVIIIFSILIIINLAPKLGLENKIELTRAYSTICAGLSGGMLAVALTAMSILVGMINDDFMKLIHKADAYYDFVTPFYLNAAGWSFGIIINIFILVITYLNSTILNSNKSIIICVIAISIGFLISNVKGSLDLVFTSIRLGEYRAKLLLKEENRK